MVEEAKKSAIKKKATPKQGQGGTYWIVNPSGTVHQVDASHAKWRLVQNGYRQATPDEIAKYIELGGNQNVRRRIAKPYAEEVAEKLTGIEELDNT